MSVAFISWSTQNLNINRPFISNKMLTPIMFFSIVAAQCFFRKICSNVYTLIIVHCAIYVLMFFSSLFRLFRIRHVIISNGLEYIVRKIVLQPLNCSTALNICRNPTIHLKVTYITNIIGKYMGVGL